MKRCTQLMTEFRNPTLPLSFRNNVGLGICPKYMAVPCKALKGCHREDPSITTAALADEMILLLGRIS